MSLYEYAKAELDLIKKDDDGMQDMINHDVLEIVKMFEEQEHSGFSAEWAIKKIVRLLYFKPITPLTGEDGEWNEISKNTWQNKRCASVFKKYDGSCYDIDGIIVSDNGGITWTFNSRFRKEVTFPYYPPIQSEKVYIEYTEEVPPGFSGDKYEVITDKPDRIKALYERKWKESNKGVGNDG